jgi:Ca2+-binding EF-hand superfamily protein
MLSRLSTGLRPGLRCFSDVGYVQSARPLKYTRTEIERFRVEFQRYAGRDGLNLDSFERFVATKTAKLTSSSVCALSWWRRFDEDNSSTIDFGEFCSQYPNMVRLLLRNMVREEGAHVFFQEYATDGKFTTDSVRRVVERFDLEPFPDRDIKVLMAEIAPYNPEAAESDDLECWAELEDFSSMATPCMSFHSSITSYGGIMRI